MQIAHGLLQVKLRTAIGLRCAGSGAGAASAAAAISGGWKRVVARVTGMVTTGAEAWEDLSGLAQSREGRDHHELATVELALADVESWARCAPWLRHGQEEDADPSDKVEDTAPLRE